jgi:hypothetical protein
MSSSKSEFIASISGPRVVGRKRLTRAAQLLAHPIYFTTTFAVALLPWINFWVPVPKV